MDETWLEPVEEMVQLLVDQVKNKQVLEGDRRELYAAQVREKVFGDMRGFRDRFQRGYQLLLDELDADDSLLK